MTFPRAVACSVALTGLVASPVFAQTQPSNSAARWSYAGIGPSQQLIRIVAQTGACSRVLPPTIEQTLTAVRVTVVTEPTTSNPNASCPAILLFKTIYVPLAEPLAGRKLLGATPGIGTGRSPGAPLPRVVGLSPGDAFTVLRQAGATPDVVRRIPGSGFRRITSQNQNRVVLTGSTNP